MINGNQTRKGDMRIYRVHIDAPLRAGDTLELPERAAGHLVKVLRHRSGDRIRLFDGRGHEATAEIIAAHRRHGCRVRVLETRKISRESGLVVELLPGMSRGEKMDWVVQKSVELGVAAIRPILSERSEVRPDGEGSRRMRRWREIVIGACEQCGRTLLPRLDSPAPVDQVRTDASTRIVLDPAAQSALADCPIAEDSVALAVGPEGGFGDRDLADLLASGFRRASFGSRVLRAETASVAAVTALQVLHGDLGRRR